MRFWKLPPILLSRHCDLTGAQLKTYIAIASLLHQYQCKRGPINVSQLAKSIDAARSGVHQNIMKLEAKGYILRSRGEFIVCPLSNIYTKEQLRLSWNYDQETGDNSFGDDRVVKTSRAHRNIRMKTPFDIDGKQATGIDTKVSTTKQDIDTKASIDVDTKASISIDTKASNGVDPESTPSLSPSSDTCVGHGDCEKRIKERNKEKSFLTESPNRSAHGLDEEHIPSEKSTKEKKGGFQSFDDLSEEEKAEIENASSRNRRKVAGHQKFFSALTQSASKNASKVREKAVNRAADPKKVPTNTPQTYKHFVAEVKKRWPDAVLPAMAKKKDLSRVKADVLIYKPAEVVSMIEILVKDWEVARERCFPYCPDRLHPQFENLWQYSAELASAVGKGMTSWNNRVSGLDRDREDGTFGGFKGGLIDPRDL